MCVLMPTRNEAGNVAPLLDRLGPALAGMDGEVPGGEPVAVQLRVPDSQQDLDEHTAAMAPLEPEGAHQQRVRD